MKILLAALALTCFLTTPLKGNASEPEYKVHVIYAGDQSASMRLSHHPSWMNAQQTFLAQYFNNYQSRCQELHIDYVGWGTEALPPLRTVLRSNVDGKNFSSLLVNLTFQNMQGTAQHKGMLHALSWVADGYDRTIIIFVSDEYLGGEKDAGLWELVPPHVELVGISLGSDSVAGYFKRHIVPPTVNGRHYHASTIREFEKILYHVFDGLGYDHCPAS
ncbi:hypothetical protein K2P47_00190 [Patescibacteria group bacterium]|nr:hypothetical protein [Patescibacteria group bacterium]